MNLQKRMRFAVACIQTTLTIQGVASWRDFAHAIIDGAVLHHPVTVQPILTSEYPTAATRPAYSALDASRFAAIFGWDAPNWQDGLRRCLAERSQTA